MKAILIQPPFVQLNAPYPAVHYLEAFLRGQGVQAESFDHSISLYRRIFSRGGLSKVFADARAAVDAKKESVVDSEAQPQVDRYLSYERLYIEWIDGIVDFLSGGDPAMAHRLSAAAELPRGARTETFLEARDGRIDPDEARALATCVLDDLGDFIAYALDPAFGTVRYAERLASSRADFEEVRKALDSSWLMHEFYEPMLEEFWSARAGDAPDLVLITIPFPGCLIGALACARAARRVFDDRMPRIVFGGGYVSTELRGLRDTGIFDFCDYLAFDAGYGSLASIMADAGGANIAGGASLSDDVTLSGDASLYRTMYRRGDEALIVAGFPAGDSAREESGPGRVLVDCADEEGFHRLEAEAVKEVFPDYLSADFGSYLRVVDSGNAMHRLWSDTPWLKFSLAHGCYWRRCFFCDTELEYVADFSRVKTDALFAAACKAGKRTGLSGIHFVDEAMPMAALLDFARANRSGDARPFSFWGNVRFDASWTQGRSEFLAASGLIAVSGGIEIATERGLEMTGKGFDLANLVRTLVAMRRAGLLIHTYLIYGFPGQPAADIVDSAEFCRQLFASGLVDSAFWHRFVLTRHSRMYGEWKNGIRPSLKPRDKPWSFANNDLSFEGEPAFDRFDAPLAASLDSWMEGKDLDKALSTWFGRSLPKASIAPDFVESLITSAEKALDAASPDPKSRFHWVAGLPLVRAKGLDKATLTWVYRGEIRSVELPAAKARSVAAILATPKLGIDGKTFTVLEAELALPRSALKEFISAGLVGI